MKRNTMMSRILSYVTIGCILRTGEASAEVHVAVREGTLHDIHVDDDGPDPARL